MQSCAKTFSVTGPKCCIIQQTTSLSKTDFNNYYDRQAHPPTSIDLQSWGILPVSPVCIISLSMMHFCLYTGFSKSTDSYGVDCRCWLSFIGFRPRQWGSTSIFCSSQRIVNEYVQAHVTRCQFHNIVHMQCLFIVSFHVCGWHRSTSWGPDASTLNEEIFEQVQQAITGLGLISQATGEALKTG